MRTYITRRLLQIIPVFIGIIFILFFIMEQAPGGPLDNLMDPMMTPEQKAELALKLGLDQPFYVKFVNWFGELVKGNLGYSIHHKRPVIEVIGNHIGPTFILALCSLGIALLIGVPCGVLSAVKQHSWVDSLLTVISLIGISLPAFFFGLILLKQFAVDVQIFPLFGFQDPLLRNSSWWIRTRDIAWHLVLPSIVLGLNSTASFMRYTRSSMLEVIKQDYVRTARAKGLKENIVIFRHAFRNAMIPIITLLGFQIPHLLSGAVVTESVFGYPGIGKVSVEAINNRNYPLILGINAMLAMVTLLSTIVADILYAAADPRIKFE